MYVQKQKQEWSYQPPRRHLWRLLLNLVAWQKDKLFYRVHLWQFQAHKSRFNKLTSVFHASVLLLIMNFVRKNVDTLRACKRSNRDFFHLSTGNTYIFSSLVFLYVTRGVLRCLLGFLAFWRILGVVYFPAKRSCLNNKITYFTRRLPRCRRRLC